MRLFGLTPTFLTDFFTLWSYDPRRTCRLSYEKGANMILFRPVGQKEKDLIEESGFTVFPPRLAWQPIFYPVLNQRYAEEIAGKWNTKDADSGYIGYVTRFEIDDNYIAAFPVHTVGASYHQELWIPAEELEIFNSKIIGKIEIITTLT